MKALAKIRFLPHPTFFKQWLALPFLITFLFQSNFAFATDIRLAVASNFRSTLATLVDAYMEKYQMEGNVSFGISSASTGVLYAQIKRGAPFDVFFSADEHTAIRLSNLLTKNQLSTEQPFTYAHGLLTYWCPDGSPKTLNELKQWRGNYAIANPKLAPYGKAAQHTIAKLNWQQHSQVIMGNNVSQVAQFVMTKNVDCGFVAKSLLPRNTPATQVLIIPDNAYSPIVQQALVLPNAFSQHEKTHRVKHFVQFIKHEARSLIAEQGYGLPKPYANYYVYNNTQVK